MEAPNYFAETLGRQHPLYVVKVSTILDESFTEIRKHEVLKKEGLLVEYEDSMSEPVLFCSHTWLRRSAPDNSQHVKLTLLKSVLRRAVEGSLGNLSPHWLTVLAYKEESAALHLQADDLRKLKDGYVFFDYMSIPQEDREAQGRAIASLVSYVSSSAYFMCLAGPWTHEDFGAARDDLACSRSSLSLFIASARLRRTSASTDTSSSSRPHTAPTVFSTSMIVMCAIISSTVSVILFAFSGSISGAFSSPLDCARSCASFCFWCASACTSDATRSVSKPMPATLSWFEMSRVHELAYAESASSP